MRKNFYSYNSKGRTYSELVQHFTSCESALAMQSPAFLQLCVVRAYHKYKLTGIITVELMYNWQMNGQTGQDEVFICPFEPVKGVLRFRQYNVNEALYEIINQRVLNLRLDELGRVMPTVLYLRKNAPKETDLSAYRILTAREYDKFKDGNHPLYSNKSKYIMELLRDNTKFARIYNNLSKVNLADYLDTSGFDLDKNNKLHMLAWDDDAILKGIG